MGTVCCTWLCGEMRAAREEAEAEEAMGVSPGGAGDGRRGGGPRTPLLRKQRVHPRSQEQGSSVSEGTLGAEEEGTEGDFESPPSFLHLLRAGFGGTTLSSEAAGGRHGTPQSPYCLLLLGLESIAFIPPEFARNDADLLLSVSASVVPSVAVSQGTESTVETPPRTCARVHADDATIHWTPAQPLKFTLVSAHSEGAKLVFSVFIVRQSSGERISIGDVFLPLEVFWSPKHIGEQVPISKRVLAHGSGRELATELCGWVHAIELQDGAKGATPTAALPPSSSKISGSQDSNGVTTTAANSDSTTSSACASASATGIRARLAPRLRDADETEESESDDEGIGDTLTRTTTAGSLAPDPSAPRVGDKTEETEEEPDTGRTALQGEPVPTEPYPNDRIALQHVYDGMRGPDWMRNEHWCDDAAPLRNWYGVTVDDADADQVKKLSLLGANNLVGPLPGAIAGFQNLRGLELDLSHSEGGVELSAGAGHFPGWLTSISSLVVLTITHAHMSGHVPREITRLQNLRGLNLSSNALSGGISRMFGNMTNLVQLNLAHNRLSGRIPRELGNLSSLRYLSIAYNQLTGPLPPEISGIQRLQWLRAEHNTGLCGSLPPELGDLSSLQYLFVHHCGFNGPLPGALAKASELRELHCDHCRFSGKIPAEIASLPRLEIANFSHNGFSGTIPTSFATASSSLRELNIANTKLRDVDRAQQAIQDALPNCTVTVSRTESR